MSHNTLQNYYRTVYNVTAKNRFCSITEYENLMPFERDVYFAIEEQEAEEEQKRQTAPTPFDM